MIFRKKKRGASDSKAGKLILWFDELGIEDVPYVGGKNASLGEMYRNLTKKKVRIPNGFAITANAYRILIEKSGIGPSIRKILAGLDTSNTRQLAEKGHKIRHLIRSATLPPELVHAISVAYKRMCVEYGRDCDVAVRSSATAEDLPTASFAGQQETYLNVRGVHHLIDACKNCFASLFTNRAISYRVDKGFDHFKVALSIGVQKMVRSDLACSGVMFSIDTESGFKDAVYLTGAYGLGENVVQGAVSPDQFYIFKPTLKKGFYPIISKQVGTKSIKMIYDLQGMKNSTKNVKVTPEDQKKLVITDDEIILLAKWACIIEDHYSEKAGHFKPMDMEWAKDGKTGELFIVQARPETVMSQKDKNVIEEFKLRKKGKTIIKGNAVGQRIGAGSAHVIKDTKDIHSFKKGEVLITDMTDPDWEPIMKIASAIVTNRGGRTCHAAIISRELGIPCLVGTKTGTEVIKNKQPVTVSCAEGDEGVVYEGVLPIDVVKHDLKKLPKTKTKIMVNLANPEIAFATALMPTAGVGLAREEFIINSYIKIHPLALIHYNTLKDKKLKKQIDELTLGYKNKAAFFVDKLAEGIARIAAAFYPRQVILRFSDFKSNEYANLIGGQLFEPKEDNPMLGWRGASRYYTGNFKEAFALECKAIKKVREKMGLNNLEVMIPICRTVTEAKQIIKTLSANGLKQGKNGLKVICMCEVPANAILAGKFLDIFDGFSIGSNDLTQFTLAVDRDSELVAPIYDERNEAVLRLIHRVIDIANKRGKYVGICGEGPSTYPDFAKFLVECGIQSMSLTPDSIMKTILAVAKTEEKVEKRLI